MSPPVAKNFRGRRALLLLPDDENRATLSSTLTKLGLAIATATEPQPSCDILFFDADEGSDVPGLAEPKVPAVPVVAVIGLEAPSRLAKVVRRRCASHIMKPVRPAGVFSAIVLAFNEHQARCRDMNEREAFAARLRGRRALVRAILRTMQTEAVDEDEAYRRLRRESMQRRVPIEILAQEQMDADASEPVHDGVERTAVQRIAKGR